MASGLTTPTKGEIMIKKVCPLTQGRGKEFEVRMRVALEEGDAATARDTYVYLYDERFCHGL